MHGTSTDNRDLLYCPRLPNMSPVRCFFAKHIAFVEQINISPLATLRLLRGQGIAKGELVKLTKIRGRVGAKNQRDPEFLGDVKQPLTPASSARKSKWADGIIKPDPSNASASVSNSL